MKQKVGIGIDIGGTSIKYGLVSSKGEIYWSAEKPTEGLTSADIVIKNVLDAVDEVRAKAKDLNMELFTVGIGTPGLVKNANTIVTSSNISGWENINLGTLVSEHTGLKCFVANDADMMGLGEFTASKSHKKDTVLFITLGTGIGGALFIKGKLFQGHFGVGGELGFFPMFVNDKVRHWEELGATSVLVKSYKKICEDAVERNQVDGKYIIQKYQEGEQNAIDCIEEMTKYIGMGLGGFINLINPKRIVIGGGISQAGDFFIDLIKKQTEMYALKECLSGVEFQAATLGNKAGFVGAALYGLKKVKKK